MDTNVFSIVVQMLGLGIFVVYILPVIVVAIMVVRKLRFSSYLFNRWFGF